MIGRSFRGIVAAATIVVVAFDIVASLASKSLGFSYTNAVAGSILLYLTIGYFLARTATGRRVAAGMAIVGAADATVGWWFSWVIGPGRARNGVLSLSEFSVVALSVIALAVIFGSLGGIFGKHSRRDFQSSASSPDTSNTRTD